MTSQNNNGDSGSTDKGIIHLAAAALFVFLLVASLYLARGILLPIVVALLFSLLLVRASDWLGTLPALGRLPSIWRRVLVLAFVAVICLMLGLLLVGMFDRIIQVLPKYEENIESLVSKIATTLGLEQTTIWQTLWAGIRDAFDLRSLALTVFNSVGSIGGTTFLVTMYVAFLIAERETFPKKIARAFKGAERNRRTGELIAMINNRIADYLAAKTLINIILAAISYGVLRVFDIDFALFWAILIGLLNYIPYIGSWIAVFFPVVISLGQLGSLATTALLATAMTVVQIGMGNFVEPWLVGRRVNLSPFVVLVALVAWTTLWGLAGAILAVPLTSAIAIICAAFPATLPVAVFLSADISAPDFDRYAKPQDPETPTDS